MRWCLCWTVLPAIMIAARVSPIIGQQPQQPSAEALPGGKKFKLLDGPGFSGPGAQDLLGSAVSALREKKIQVEIGLLPVQTEELQRLTDQVNAEVEPLVREFKRLAKAEQQTLGEGYRSELATHWRRVNAALEQ